MLFDNLSHTKIITIYNLAKRNSFKMLHFSTAANHSRQYLHNGTHVAIHLTVSAAADVMLMMVNIQIYATTSSTTPRSKRGCDLPDIAQQPQQPPLAVLFGSISARAYMAALAWLRTPFQRLTFSKTISTRVPFMPKIEGSKPACGMKASVSLRLLNHWSRWRFLLFLKLVRRICFIWLFYNNTEHFVPYEG